MLIVEVLAFRVKFVVVVVSHAGKKIVGEPEIFHVPEPMLRVLVFVLDELKYGVETF